MPDLAADSSSEDEEEESKRPPKQNRNLSPTHEESDHNVSAIVNAVCKELDEISLIKSKKGREELLLKQVETLLTNHNHQVLNKAIHKVSEITDWKWRMQLADKQRAKTNHVKILLLHNTHQGWYIALTKEKDGKLCWPGGKVDASDLSLAHAASRKVSEETGIRLRVSNLQDIGTEVSNFEDDVEKTSCACFAHVTPIARDVASLPPLKAGDGEMIRDGVWMALNDWLGELPTDKVKPEHERTFRFHNVGLPFERVFKTRASVLTNAETRGGADWEKLLDSKFVPDSTLLLWNMVSEVTQFDELAFIVQEGEKAIGSTEFAKVVGSVVDRARAQEKEAENYGLERREEIALSDTDEYQSFITDVKILIEEVQSGLGALEVYSGEDSQQKRTEEFVSRTIALGEEADRELGMDTTISEATLGVSTTRHMSGGEVRFWSELVFKDEPLVAAGTPASLQEEKHFYSYIVRACLYPHLKTPGKLSTKGPMHRALKEKALDLQQQLFERGRVRMSAELMDKAVSEREQWHRQIADGLPQSDGSAPTAVNLFKSLQSETCNVYEIMREVAWFEYRMVWMVEWMIASWETQVRGRGSQKSLTDDIVADLQELEQTSTNQKYTSLPNTNLCQSQDCEIYKPSIVCQSRLTIWGGRLNEIKRRYETKMVGQRNVRSRKFHEWDLNHGPTDVPWREEDTKLICDGAVEYQRWVLHRNEDLRISLNDKVAEDEEGKKKDFSRPCVFNRQGLTEMKQEWLERKDITDYGVNLCLMAEEMEKDQEIRGLEMPGELRGDGTVVDHKPRIKRWLLRRSADANIRKPTDDIPTYGEGLPQLKDEAMTIPDMLKRFAKNHQRAREDDAEKAANEDIRLDYLREATTKTEVWPSRRLTSDLHTWLNEIEQSGEGYSESFEERQYWLEQMEQEVQLAGIMRQKFEVWNRGRGPFSEVGDDMVKYTGYREWRSKQTQHLQDLCVKDGKLERHFDQNESDQNKTARLKVVTELWVVANDGTEYEVLGNELKRERGSLTAKLEQVNRHITWARDAETRKSSKASKVRGGHIEQTHADYTEFYNQHLKNTDTQYLREFITLLVKRVSLIHEQLEEVRIELLALEERENVVTEARRSFNRVFYVSPKWDVCTQHVEDTLMVFNLLIHERQNQEGFEPEKVLTDEEVDKTDWTIIQLESEDLAKTELALAKFHKEYLTEELPELRPDKFPQELWALTRTDRKREAHEAWKLFSESRLREVVPKMMSIDISKETAARRREEPYLRAQILCNIDTWVYPDENNPPMLEGFEYSIDLIDPKIKPFKCKQRRYSILERFSLRARCLNMLEKKKIQKSTSEWASPPRLVAYDDRIRKFLEEHKEDTMEALHSIGTDRKMRETVQNLYRFTSDMRRVNEATKLVNFPMPNIPDLINKCQGKDRYTCLDLEDAFFVVKCAEESRHLTAFMTPDGLFEYLVMVQGGKCSANVFAKIVSEVFYPLRDQPFMWYQDDLVNHENTDVVEHMQMQERIYTQCRKYHLILKPSKAHMNFTTQRVLGYIVSKEGRSVDPNLVSAITKLAIPRTLQNIQSLLGLAQVAREYVPAMATIIAPLQSLAKKGIDVEKEWNPSIHGVAFDNLKKILTSAPVLLIPDVTKKFRVHVDCCRVGRGCGAVLLQENKRGEWQPVAYWSRSLSDAERKLSATALEATAMHDAILHWKVYLTGGLPFDVITDHYALVYMITKIGGDIHGRMSRMVMDLQGFTFSVTHRSGALHLDADAVSRLLQVDEDPYIHTIDDLRDDFGPLSEEEKKTILRTYPNKSDADKVVDIINEHRRERLIDPTVESPIPRKNKKQSDEQQRRASAIKSTNGDGKAAEPKDPEFKDASQRQIRQMQRQEEMNLDMKDMVDMPDEPWARDLLEVSAASVSNQEEEDEFWIDVNHEGVCMAARMGAISDSEYAQVSMVTTDIEEGVLLVGHLATRKSARIEHLRNQQSAKRIVEEQLSEARKQEAIERAAEKLRFKQEKAKMREEANTGVHNKRIRREDEMADASNQKLSDFNNLVMRHFVMDKTLFEVVNTFQDKSADKFMAMVQEYDDEKKLLTTSDQGRRVLPILGPEGVQALVMRFEEGQRQLVDDGEFPVSDKMWAVVQREEGDYAELLEAFDKTRNESKVQQMVLNRGKHDEVIFERKLQQPTTLELEAEEAKEDEANPVMGPIKRSRVMNHSTNDGCIKIQIPVSQILVPLKYRQRCLVRFHEELGHPGVKRMLKTMAHSYYWKEMKTDVKEYVDRCHYCKCRKTNTHHAKPPIQSYSLPLRPFFRVHMDITELTTTTTGFRYVLVIKDALTKWVELIPLVTKTAEEVVNALVEHVILRHGVPVTLITDKGSENCNSIMKKVTELLQCEHISTTPYNPRSDGLVENQMRTLKDQLAAWTNKFHNDWDKHLQKVAHAYRVTVNDATGFTPYYLNHGRECNTPTEAWLEAFDEEDQLGEFADNLRQKMLAAWQLTALRVVKNVETFNRVPRRHIEFEPYAVGQYVFLKVIPKRVYSEGYKKKKHKLSSKLQYRYVGPFRITKKLNDVLYEADIHNSPTRIHAVNMKPV